MLVVCVGIVASAELRDGVLAQPHDWAPVAMAAIVHLASGGAIMQQALQQQERHQMSLQVLQPQYQPIAAVLPLSPSRPPLPVMGANRSNLLRMPTVSRLSAALLTRV